jgi:hypothetical protein
VWGGINHKDHKDFSSTEKTRQQLSSGNVPPLRGMITVDINVFAPAGNILSWTG